MLLMKRFTIFQNVFSAVRQSFSFSLTSQACFVHTFEIMFKLSKLFSVLLFLKCVVVNVDHFFLTLSFIDIAYNYT